MNELDASKPSSAPSPQPRSRATVKEDKSTEPVYGPPDLPRRKTSSPEDSSHGGRSVAGTQSGARNIQTVFGLERKSSALPVRRAEVSSAETRSTRDRPRIRGESIRRYRSRSRRGSRRIMPWKLTCRRSSSSRSKGWGTRRSKKGDPSMKIYHKTPDRTII